VHTTLEVEAIGQLFSVTYVVPATWAKFGLHTGNMKFGIQDAE
jgi:hypothetical protein